MKHALRNFAAALALLATPVAGHAAASIAGILNFHQVTDRLYRGGQPEGRAWGDLARVGVKTVLDLRRGDEHSVAAESLAVCAAGMRYVNFPMNGSDTPTALQLSAPLALLDGGGPAFVHCAQGRDRTGTVIAAYRISRQRWANRDALAEAQRMGMHWYEGGMKRFIAAYRPEPVAPAPVAEAAAAPAESLRAAQR